MKQLTRFMCALEGITIEEELGPGVLLEFNNIDENLPKIYLTNDSAIIRDKLGEEFKEIMGYIEYYHIHNSNAVVFADGYFDSDTMEPVDYLNIHLRILKTFFSSLWVVKDNSVDFDLGFIFFKNDDNPNVSSNLYSSKNFTSLGKTEHINFTRKELEIALEYFKKHIIVELDTSEKISGSQKEYGRISTGSYFIQTARSTDDIGLKFSNYCSGLETLFSNDNSELSHKLSERVSRTLRKNVEARIECYKMLKKSYNIRSKVVHGGSFKTKQLEEMREIVVILDNVCREIMGKMADDPKFANVFTLNNEQFEEYFLKLILT